MFFFTPKKNHLNPTFKKYLFMFYAYCKRKKKKIGKLHIENPKKKKFRNYLIPSNGVIREVHGLSSLC